MTPLFIVALWAAIIYVQDVTSSGCLSDVDDLKMSKTAIRDLYRGQQIFSIEMLKLIYRDQPENKNIFFSPYSTYHALLLTYFGARNVTERELYSALHLNWAQNKYHVHLVYQLEKQHRFLRTKDSSVHFFSTNKIFFSRETNLRNCMIDLLYDDLESVDFRSDPEGSRIKINNGITNITRNEIQDVLHRADIDTETNLVLINAAYFKGQWESNFNSSNTKRDIFYSSPTKSFIVDMMYSREAYNFAVDERLNALILEMPFVTKKESDISMVILLPPFTQNGFEKVLQNLTPETLSMALKGGWVHEVDVTLPKFKLEESLDLLPILKKIGINDLFNSRADLTGFSVNNQLSLNDAKHVAKIIVNEDSSSDATSTVLFTSRLSRPREATLFHCNHPFLFLIYDHQKQAILFTGIYRNP